ncbi:MAG: NHL repeat-containing protein [Candidatus Acidiferrales bacterium]
MIPKRIENLISRVTCTGSRFHRWYFLLLPVAALFFVSCGKRADPAPKPKSPLPFEFAGAWGDKGDGPGKFDQPVAFATDLLGRVFFVDPAAGFVDKFESNGTPLLTFQDSRVRHAAGIAVDSGGAIYIADAERGIVTIFFPNGTFLRELRIAPQRHFSGTLGISVDGQGNLYVPDPNGSRVVRLNDRGRVSGSWPAPRIKSPGERPTSVAAAEDGSFYVAYSQTGRIEKYSHEGSLVTSWNAAENPTGESQPVTGLAVGEGYVFTMSAVPAEVRVWTLDGQHKLDADLGAHLGATAIAAPQIAVTPHSEFLVFDPAASRVCRFRMHLDTKEQP